MWPGDLPPKECEQKWQVLLQTADCTVSSQPVHEDSGEPFWEQTACWEESVPE